MPKIRIEGPIKEGAKVFLKPLAPDARQNTLTTIEADSDSSFKDSVGIIGSHPTMGLVYMPTPYALKIINGEIEE